MAKVLIVDDEITMVQMVTELLRAEGHEVFPFNNFNSAIEGIESIQPELVISDLYLDKTRAHGLEILQKARALHPPAIVVHEADAGVARRVACVVVAVGAGQCATCTRQAIAVGRDCVC